MSSLKYAAGDIVVNFKIGDIVVVNSEAYEEAFVGEIGYVASMPYLSFSYITFFSDPEQEILFKNSEIFLKPLDG
jgi:hypothetical protein